ncbi:sigma 54-interacting transcriptional regulator [Intestinimonas massiliensis]|uniref:Sigma 54-interacting transcriptional regulator n=1 Tax=Intestinimonas massiliensis (ex Afouda et al. 2020) TaxID=1673721 RepID=A0ABS9M8C3_9FIRM|nr:sigma 54-interacting transcriptional regulator [Intestinimonas massiliensis (ex Afouda et al. 2020)]MCG4526873.1 sigma 54-interacting transcriptional regulator [Intestinimonas massiliensis (ex Afouda et al. 2020)]MCQ4807262.1 sigma 54-interacting transcriptional regulator [Intestinimonas massiliensis (ex Afouda et al. 2020)]
MELNEAARAAFNAMREGITIIDTDGIIVFGNTAYREFLNKEAGGDIGPIEGYRLRDLRPGARLPDVLEKGEPILHLTRQEVEDFYFVNLYPIYRDGVLLGGLSVVTFLDDAYRAREELEAMEARSKQVLHRINKANGARYTFDDIVAESPAGAQTKALAEKIAATDATVLLESESGTGKELYAQAIHNASLRREGVFVAINCANFNSNMLESELFGYVEGAFTGAKKGGKLGLFEAAAGGTLFLDEISEMDLGLQAKLLRVLQERRIRPVGGVKEIDVDVRVIAACNASLPDYVDQGKFRKDLYYRLNTFPIHIPPLRERTGDIPALATAILDQLSHKLRRPFTLTDEAVRLLQAHSWPGNVRELRNVLEFSAYLTPSGVITCEAFPADLRRPAEHDAALPLVQRVRAFEKREIQRLLARNGTSLEGKKKTAAQLGISLASLYNKLNAPDF